MQEIGRLTSEVNALQIILEKNGVRFFLPTCRLCVREIRSDRKATTADSKKLFLFFFKCRQKFT